MHEAGDGRGSCVSHELCDADQAECSGHEEPERRAEAQQRRRCGVEALDQHGQRCHDEAAHEPAGGCAEQRLLATTQLSSSILAKAAVSVSTFGCESALAIRPARPPIPERYAGTRSAKDVLPYVINISSGGAAGGLLGGWYRSATVGLTGDAMPDTAVNDQALREYPTLPIAAWSRRAGFGIIIRHG